MKIYLSIVTFIYYNIIVNIIYGNIFNYLWKHFQQKSL